MTDLTCPTCDLGPFRDLRSLRNHERAHQTATCPECGAEVKAPGLGPHRYHAHGITAAPRPQRAGKATAPPTGNPRNLAGALAVMLPGAARGLVDQLAAFVARHHPPRDLDLWVVATPAGKPRLCRTGQVGLVCRVDLGPSIVVRVADIYDHVTHYGAAS